jgi:arylsulfatase A-like enzyme
MLSRRDAIQSLIGAGVSGAPAILRGASRTPGDKPNLLFLWTDEQRADTMAAYGNRRFRVPSLNKLASESVVFERCYDTQPVCTPARSSVLTGLWPHTSGCIHNNIALKRDTKTLPELLDDDAYRTGYIGKWHLGDEVFAQHGFQEWISIEDIYTRHFSPGRDQGARSSFHHFLAELGYKPDTDDNKFSRQYAVRRPVEHCKPAFMASEAARFLLENRSQPWLLHINFLEPHMPFFGPYNDLHSAEEAPIPDNYPGAPIEREPVFYRGKRRGYYDNGYGGHDLKSRPGWQRLNRNYAGLCSQVDQAVGRILWALETSGQAENTIVVYTSDHGEMMGSHGLIGKGVMYEESVRVPMLLRAPFRRHAHFTFPKPVSHISLVPTLLELLGRPVPGELPGESLVGVMEGRRPAEDHVFSQWHSRGDDPNARAVFSPDGWKLVLYDTDNCLLFNRRDDPLEMHNLYYRSEYRDVIRGLRAKIEAWQREVGDSF